MTTFTVPTVARPISEGMFADFGYPLVQFDLSDDGGQRVTVDADLTADQVMRAKCRLLSPDAGREALLWAAYQAWKDNKTYLALPTPTQSQAVAQVAALTRRQNGVLEYLLPDLKETSPT